VSGVGGGGRGGGPVVGCSGWGTRGVVSLSAEGGGSGCPFLLTSKFRGLVCVGGTEGRFCGGGQRGDV